MITAITFLTAVSLAAVAAYFSIIGLMAIFSAAAIPIAVMGSVLEVAKLVSASWVYRNWDTAPKAIKYYLTGAIAVLMFITSMGIFGYLSKAHIEQSYSQSDNSIIIKNLEREIKSEEQLIVTAQRSIDILDRLVSEANPKDANWIRSRQKKEREVLNSDIRTSSERIKALNIELTPLRQQSAALEAEVGPLKYVADLIYGESDKELLEKAVRWVIIVIIFVFDPLAVLLLIAANISSNKPAPVPAPVTPPTLPKKKGRPKKTLFDNSPAPNWSPELYKRANVNIDSVKIDKERIHSIPKEILDKVFKK